MGFDIHGMNPVQRVFKEEKYPIYNKYSDMDFAERQKIFNDNEELQSKYFEEMQKREDENPGIYFRNNVWWWRPLWNYVCAECDDILSEEDMDSGQYNDGRLITEDKACAIAKRLFERIETGHTKGCEDFHRKVMKEAEENNKGKTCGDEDYDWSSSYPFDVENVRSFAIFCAESGGFEIC